MPKIEQNVKRLPVRFCGKILKKELPKIRVLCVLYAFQIAIRIFCEIRKNVGKSLYKPAEL